MYAVSRSGYWQHYAPLGWKGHRPDGRPEDGGIWEPRMPDGVRPAAQCCSDWTEAQRLDWVAAQHAQSARDAVIVDGYVAALGY
jgi:hypothetical protein